MITGGNALGNNWIELDFINDFTFPCSILIFQIHLVFWFFNYLFLIWGYVCAFSVAEYVSLCKVPMHM